MRRRLLALCSVVLLLVASVGLALPDASAADVGCSLTGSPTPQGALIVSCPVGTADSWTVPIGVTQATFDVQGAAGGNGIEGSDPPVGGRGGHARATFAVTPPLVYSIDVGAIGGNAGSSPGSGGAPGGADGINGGCVSNYGCSYGGGGGGGASIVALGAVATVSGFPITGNWKLVAGAGGGGGGDGGDEPGSDGGGLLGGSNPGNQGGNQTGTTGSGQRQFGSSPSDGNGGGGGGGGFWGGAGGCCGQRRRWRRGAGAFSERLPARDQHGQRDGHDHLHIRRPSNGDRHHSGERGHLRAGSGSAFELHLRRRLGGTGIVSCFDQYYQPSGTVLDTTAGPHTLSVTALSSDGFYSTTNITYNVAASNLCRQDSPTRPTSRVGR